MELLKTLEAIRTPFGNVFFTAATYLAEEVLLLTLIMVLYWCVDKKLAYRLIFGYMISALAVNIIKLACRIERPWVRDPSLKPLESAKGSATGYSFPSGHTQNAVSIYGTFAHRIWKGDPDESLSVKDPAALSDSIRRGLKERWAVIPCLLLIPLVMFSRMYLGVHTLEDVAVSLLVSSVIIFALNMIIDRMSMNRTKRLVIMLCMLAAAAAALTYALILYNNGTVAYAQIADICKGAGAGMAFAVCWYIETEHIKFSVETNRLWMQAVKLAIGAAGAMGLKSGIKAVFGSNPVSDISRYFLMMIWAMLIMPLVIKKYFAKK